MVISGAARVTGTMTSVVALAACGRIGFGRIGADGGRPGDAAATDAAGLDGRLVGADAQLSDAGPSVGRALWGFGGGGGGDDLGRAVAVAPDGTIFVLGESSHIP